MDSGTEGGLPPAAAARAFAAPVAAVFVAQALITAVLIAAAGCSPAFVPNPPEDAEMEEAWAARKPGNRDAAAPSGASRWVDEPMPERGVRTYDVDFARAFEEDPAPRDTSAPPAEPRAPFTHSFRYPSLRLPKRPVRVLLRRDVREATINSSANVQVRAPNLRANFRGGMSVEADVGGPGGTVVATVNRARREVRLPCTLFISTGGGGRTGDLLSVGQSPYRGALIITRGTGSAFTIINAVNVEDYLRGVVPLEIGNLREAEIEAVKAQAVAARTYTYKKMAANAGREFDLVSTVADQVYGGAAAETETADMAIVLTKDLVMAYEDEIVHAYYHSTCGGKTANIEDVWGGGAQPYLRSINDADGRGRAYCSGSSSFTWTEKWSEGQLAGILRRYSADGRLEPAFTGGPRRIEARERFACGRVKTLVVVGGGNREHVAGGDRTRFLLRRNVPSRQILRSSNFRNAVFSADGHVTITGAGYGHGIGMCQVGAIGRSREGQNFEQILKAYYSGVLIRTVIDEK